MAKAKLSPKITLDVLGDSDHLPLVVISIGRNSVRLMPADAMKLANEIACAASDGEIYSVLVTALAAGSKPRDQARFLHTITTKVSSYRRRCSRRN